MTNREWLFLAISLLLWRIILQVVAIGADNLIPYQPSFPFVEELIATEAPRWVYSWSNFDGIHYHTIAQQGYIGFGLIQAFFPVYPIVIKLLMAFGLQSLHASLIVAHLATVATVIGLYVLSRDWWGKSVAQWSVVTFLLFPTSFFLIAGYTESLFLALIFWSFWLLQKKRWLLAGLLAGIASGTKVVGVLWSLVILIEYLLHTSVQTKYRSAILLTTLLLSISGFLMYSGYLQREFNDFLYYLHVQSQFGAGRSDSFIMLPQVFWRSIKILVTARPFDLRYYTYVLEFLSAVWAITSLILAWRFKLPKSLILFSALVFLVPTLTGTFSSLPRYLLTVPTSILVLGPMFTQLSRRHVLLTTVILLVLTFSLVINTALFIQGHWIS